MVQPEASRKADIMAQQPCQFIIDAEIIQKLMGDLLLEDDDTMEDTDHAKKNALKYLGPI